MAEKIILPSGIRLVVEPMPYLHSLTVGVWTNIGSAGEPQGLYGTSHFLEHMLFKGTAKRNSLTISSTMESVGGILNAFTGKECTCFYARCLDEYFDLALDLLSDMYCHSLIDTGEFSKEKNVIIEEINMYEDTPDDLVVDAFSQLLWPDHPYGRSVAGSITSVEALARDDLYNYWHSRYTAKNTTIAVAGNVTMAQVKDEVEKHFGDFGGDFILPEMSCTVCGKDKMKFICKDIEQVHVCMGFPAIAIDDDDYCAAQILCNALGGGASSRLFQEVREKRGLSYSAYSFLDSYIKGGFFAAYASSRPGNVEELVKVIANEFANIAAHGLSNEEIIRAKAQLKGALYLSMESSTSMMNRLGRYETYLNRIVPVEETVDKLMSVTEADIKRFSERILLPGQLRIALVGPEGFTDIEGLF